MTYGNQGHHSGYCKRTAAFPQHSFKGHQQHRCAGRCHTEKILRKAAEMGYKQFAYLPLFQEDAAKTAEPFILPSDKREIAMLTTQFLSSSHFSSTMLDRFQSEIKHLHSCTTVHRISPIELKRKSFHLLSTSSAQPASSALKYSTMTTHRCCAIWIFRCCL